MSTPHEFLWSRSAVYEALRAKRRRVLRVQVAESAQQKGRLAEILNLCRETGVPVEHVPRARLDKISRENQGVAAEAEPYPYGDLIDILQAAQARAESPFVLILDALQDPQNFGTLLRTAEAAGVHGAVIPLANAVEVTPAVCQASAGACEHMLVARANIAQAIDTLKSDNVWIVGLDQQGQSFNREMAKHLSGALGLVVGSEGEGMRALVRAKCDVLLQLPMSGRVASLNASAAGAIVIYLAHLERQGQLQRGMHA